MAVTLAAIFGSAGLDIAERIAKFDWKKIDVRDGKYSEYLHDELAPSYGTLTSESIRAMDDHLKVMIAGTMNNLAKLPSNQRTAKNIESVMMNNTLLEPEKDSINRSDKIIKDDMNYFKFDGSPDNAIVREVLSWWTKLIADQDVLNSTKIDIQEMAKIVAQSGATIDSFETFWGKHESHQQTMLDIGVLRFPDPSHPYFKLYRIKLTAWSDSSRILFVQKDVNGITGEYYSRNFKPRQDVIADLKPEIHKKAVKEAEDLFAGIH